MRVLTTVAASLALITASFAQGKSEQFVKDELLIKFRDGISKSKVKQFHVRRGHQVLETLGDSGWQRIKLNTGKGAKQAAAMLDIDSEVEFAQPNFYYHLAATPNDPQWLSVGLYGLTKISTPAAWDISTGSSTVIVANIDTGMRYTHEDLAANMWTNPGEVQGNGFDDDNNGFADDYYGYDFFFNDPDPLDENGHGTHTGGTIGAVGNNALGVVGVNWNVRIMAIKIYDSDGFGTTSAMLVNAYNYIRMMKNRGINIRATNNSYAGCDEACGYDQATKDALDAMGDADILNVFAAGNDGWNNDTVPAPAYPAAYTSPTVLTVAASTSSDTKAGFSNFGPISVDLAAPGSGILSTTRASNSSYGSLSGTSMAAPHVAGAAALLAAFNPALSVASLKATLMNSVDALPASWAATPVKTNGRLNVFNALQNQTVCNFSLSSATVRGTTKGGYYTVSISAPQNCDFSARSNNRWIRIEGTDSRSGDGQIQFRLDRSPMLARSGTLVVAGQEITVTQARN